MSRAKRLQRILRVRVVEEEQARATWLAAEGVAREAEDRVDHLRGERGAIVRALGDGLASTSASWVLVAHEQIERARLATEAQRERALTFRTQADSVREPWAAKRAAAKGLERLVERATESEQAEGLAAEAEELDEISVMRHSARSER